MTQKHTPAPWRRGITLVTNQTERWSKDQWKKNDEIEMSYIFSNFEMYDEGKSRQLVATINRDHPDYEANAEFIVRAINCHDELLEALILVQAIAKGDAETIKKSGYSFEKEPLTLSAFATDKINAAIAKAKGEI